MPKPIPMVSLRCPKCTATFRVPEARKRVACPSCGRVSGKAPADWEPPENLDGLKPGRQKEVHGRARETNLVILFTILSLGVYALYYAYRAFKEVDDQHGRLHATWWYLFGILLLPLLIPLHIYWVIELSRLQGYRAARGMRRRIGPMRYTIWVFLPVIGFLIALALVNRSLREVWADVHKETGIRPHLAR